MGNPLRDTRKPHLMGMMHVYHDQQGLDIYNPNAPYAQARMKIVDGKAKLTMNHGAPMHFINEVQTHLDKLKTLLILGG
jgi:hypothetical protein